jgi:hypothetical protein
MKNKAFLLFLVLVTLGCAKKNNTNVVLSTNLTSCAANSTCTYNYYDNADFTNGNQPVAGNSRVFWYKSVNANICGATTEFFFKTNMGDTEFDITSSQIASGEVFANDFVCPCCENATLLKPVGGEIKGKRIDGTRWLINASIIFGTSISAPADTMVVNQYFSQQKLP